MVYNLSERWNNLIRTKNERDVGIGSRSHVLQAIFFKRAETAVSLTALKWVSGFPEKKS